MFKNYNPTTTIWLYSDYAKAYINNQNDVEANSSIL